jgi:predicted 3-demethylubiquinone-9 3-methyltransferase (glyoxalase superfamily)
MSKITPFLTYNDQAEAAARLYVSIFKNSRIVHTSRYGEGAPFPAGTAMTVVMELDGQRVIALNGGPTFSFSEGFSLSVSCETQDEIDRYWEQLTADGGAPGRCGWLVDRFGLSWQIVPASLPDLLRGPKAVQAMMTMTRLDIAALERAGKE